MINVTNTLLKWLIKAINWITKHGVRLCKVTKVHVYRNETFPFRNLMTFRFLVIRMNPIHSRDLNKIYKVKKKKKMRDLIEIVRIVDKKWYFLHKPCLLLCVGCEINKQASLIIHDAILTDQLGVVLEITTQHETETKIDFKKFSLEEEHVRRIYSLSSRMHSLDKAQYSVTQRINSL